MPNKPIDKEQAIELREIFAAASKDIKGECKNHHYPLLGILRAFGQYGDPFPEQALKEIGISPRKFRQLHALGFAKETLRGNGDESYKPFQRVYHSRLSKCLDRSTPTALGNFLPKETLRNLEKALNDFECKNPEFKPKQPYPKP